MRFVGLPDEPHGSAASYGRRKVFLSWRQGAHGGSIVCDKRSGVNRICHFPLLCPLGTSICIECLALTLGVVAGLLRRTVGLAEVRVSKTDS